jgi:hypothetical protein
MATVIQLLIGILSCFIFVLVARRADLKREVKVYTMALIAAALIYVGFAVGTGAALPWVALEVGGLALFSLIALLGLRFSVWMLALGWAAHAVWDALLDEVLKVGFVPSWYPAVCIGFDLFLAVYIVTQLRARQWPASAT